MVIFHTYVSIPEGTTCGSKTFSVYPINMAIKARSHPPVNWETRKNVQSRGAILSGTDGNEQISSVSSGQSPLSFLYAQWEFQDPKMEVLYHIFGHILCGYSDIPLKIGLI